MAHTPTDTMRRYFDTWKARRFDDFQALLADDATAERVAALGGYDIAGAGELLDIG